MDNLLKNIVEKLDAYVGNLIDVADMPVEDKAALKGHLFSAQEILVRNGNDKLQQLVGALTEAVLSRF